MLHVNGSFPNLVGGLPPESSEGYYHGLNVRGYPMLKFERNGLTVHSVSGMVDPEAASAHVTVLDQTTGLHRFQVSLPKPSLTRDFSNLGTKPRRSFPW